VEELFSDEAATQRVEEGEKLGILVAAVFFLIIDDGAEIVM
jgi:hypothetical protein